MRTLFAGLFFVFWSTSCHRTQYYYRATAPADLLQWPSDQSPVMATVQARDTLITRKRIGLADGHFSKVWHRSRKGYVRSAGHELLYTTRYQTVYGSLISTLNISPEIHFTIRSGDTKSKNRERSSAQSYRSSGSRSSTYRGSAGRGPR